MKDQEVQIKFPVFEDEEELDIITKSLDCRIFVPKDTLNKYLFQLRKIDSLLSKDENTSLHDAIEKKKKHVESLSGKCENLKHRNIAISFAEEAEAIANGSPLLSDSEVKEQADNLRARIDLYTQGARPSKNNMKFLRFAKKLLQKAAKHEPVISEKVRQENIITFREDSPAEVSLEEFALAESLYELAGMLYENGKEAFCLMLDKNFSEKSKKELNFHISNCNGFISSLDSDADIKRVIQGVIGYAHTITDYFENETPYPSFDEIENLFSGQIL